MNACSKKTISILLTAALLATHIPVLAQTAPDKVLSLAQIQTRAQQDMQTLKQKWPDIQKDLPILVALTPLIRQRAVEYAEQVEAALNRPKAVFPYNSEEFLSEQAKQQFRQFSQLLRDGDYRSAYEVMYQIDYKAWDFLRKTRGTDFLLPDHLEAFLSKQISWSEMKGLSSAAKAASEDLTLASFFVEPDPEISKLLEPYVKNLRNVDWDLRQAINALEKEPWLTKFSSKEEAKEFIRLLEKTYMKFISPSTEAKQAETFINEVREILLKMNKNGTKPSSFFMRSVKTTSGMLFRQKNILMLALFAGIGITTANRAHANGLEMAERIRTNFDLFLQANAEELKAIEQNPQAVQVCRDIAQTLHEWVARAQQGDLQQTAVQQEVSKTVRNSFSLHPVRAY